MSVGPLSIDLLTSLFKVSGKYDQSAAGGVAGIGVKRSGRAKEGRNTAGLTFRSQQHAHT